MSQVRKETIECPHCHQEGEYDLWTSVNVDLDPELREKIFSDELLMYHCPHCGKVTGIPAGTLYHDMTHGFMIFSTSSSQTIMITLQWRSLKGLAYKKNTYSDPS